MDLQLGPKVCESKDRLPSADSQALDNSMPIIVWLARADGVLDYYNDRWYEYTGMVRGGEGDGSWEPVLHPDDLQMCRDVWYSSVKTGKPYEIEYRFLERSTNEYRWHLGRAIPVRGNLGTIVRWHGTGTDIHDLKVAQEALEARQAQLTTIVETVPVGLVLADFPSGKIVGGNKYVEQMLRHPVLYSNDLDSYDEWVAFHKDGTRVDGHEYPLARMIRDGEANPTIDVNYQRGDGTLAWTRITGRPVFDRSGKITGGVVALIDINEQEEHKAALSAALAAKETLLYEVNHRVKNSLQLVSSFLVVEAAKLTEPAAIGAIKAARHQVDIVAALHRQLYSQQTHDMVNIKTSLDDLVQGLLKTAGREDIALDLQYIGDPMMHISQASPLMLVVNELLTNSLKYGSANENPTLSVFGRNADGELALEIRDNGPGFPDFNKSKSASIGLEMVKALVTQHQGVIEHDDTELGAKITLRLPSNQANIGPASRFSG